MSVSSSLSLLRSARAIGRLGGDLDEFIATLVSMSATRYNSRVHCTWRSRRRIESSACGRIFRLIKDAYEQVVQRMSTILRG